MPRKPTESASPPSPEPLPILTVDEAADLARVHRRTVLRWVAEDRIRSTRPIERGSSRRWIDRASLLEFLGVEV